METKNIIWAMLAIGLVAVFLFAAFANGQNAERQARSSANSQNEPAYLNMNVPSDFNPSAAQGAQPSQAAPAGAEKTITLGLGSGGLYSPSEISVNLGDKVTIVGDMSQLKGCTRALVIPAFGVAKAFSASDNTVTFTASKKGTFPFSCSMGMVRGTILVH